MTDDLYLFASTPLSDIKHLDADLLFDIEGFKWYLTDSEGRQPYPDSKPLANVLISGAASLVCGDSFQYRRMKSGCIKYGTTKIVMRIPYPVCMYDVRQEREACIALRKAIARRAYIVEGDGVLGQDITDTLLSYKKSVADLHEGKRIVTTGSITVCVPSYCLDERCLLNFELGDVIMIERDEALENMARKLFAYFDRKFL